MGRDQAARAAAVLAALRPASITSSDLARARTTADALSAVTGVPVALDPRLRETYGGTWQGHTAAEIRAVDGAAYDQWRLASHVDVPAGGGETRAELAGRVVPAVLDAVEAAPGGATVVVTTHGGSVRAAIGTLLALPMENWSAIAGLANCCWSVLEERPASPYAAAGWRLLEHNAGTLPQPVMGDEE